MRKRVHGCWQDRTRERLHRLALPPCRSHAEATYAAPPHARSLRSYISDIMYLYSRRRDPWTTPRGSSSLTPLSLGALARWLWHTARANRTYAGGSASWSTSA